MKKINMVSRVCIWIVNLMIVLFIIGGVYSYYSLIRFAGEGPRPESTEGMISWQDYSEVSIGKYTLSRISEYNAEGPEAGFTDYLELNVPYPQVFALKAPDNNFRIISKKSHDIVETLVKFAFYHGIGYFDAIQFGLIDH